MNINPSVDSNTPTPLLPLKARLRDDAEIQLRVDPDGIAGRLARGVLALLDRVNVLDEELNEVRESANKSGLPEAALNDPTLLRRFFSRFEMTDGCWEWQRFLPGAAGYGTLSIDGGGNTVGAHRVSFEFFHGPVPRGHLVCHRCDNPRCVNPAHLFAGTVRENSIDAQLKGRLARPNSPKGIKCPTAKLADADVFLIVERWNAGCSAPEIAREFNVAPQTISSIVGGKNWKHLNLKVTRRGPCPNKH